MGCKYPQKIYTAEFKREAVRLLETSGKSGAVIAQESGISDGSLYTWRKQLAPQGEEAFPGKGHQTPTDALWMALIRRQPAVGSGLLPHTDRRVPSGWQYTSRSYRGALSHYGIELRVSRKGKCWDNACIKSFFGTLKAELCDRRSFKSRQEAKTEIFEYMEVFTTGSVCTLR